MVVRQLPGGGGDAEECVLPPVARQLAGQLGLETLRPLVLARHVHLDVHAVAAHADARLRRVVHAKVVAALVVAKGGVAPNDVLVARLVRAQQRLGAVVHQQADVAVHVAQLRVAERVKLHADACDEVAAAAGRVRERRRASGSAAAAAHR